MCINVLFTSYTLYFVKDDKNKDVQSIQTIQTLLLPFCIAI